MLKRQKIKRKKRNKKENPNPKRVMLTLIDVISLTVILIIKLPRKINRIRDKY